MHGKKVSLFLPEKQWNSYFLFCLLYNMYLETNVIQYNPYLLTYNLKRSS